MITTTIKTSVLANTAYITKQAIIGVCVATLYFGLVVMNPFAVLTGSASLMALANIRWANLLYGLVVSSPGAAVGVATGAYMFNVYAGRVAFGGYSAIPVISATAALSAYAISRYWGASFYKDLIVACSYGLFMGIVVTLHLSTLAVVFDGETWGTLFTAAAAWKVFTHVAVTALGYIMLRPVVKVVRSYGQKGGTSQ